MYQTGKACYNGEYFVPGTEVLRPGARVQECTAECAVGTH